MSEDRSPGLTRVAPLGVVAVVWIAIALLFPTTEPASNVASGPGGVPSGGDSGGAVFGSNGSESASGGVAATSGGFTAATGGADGSNGLNGATATGSSTGATTGGRSTSTGSVSSGAVGSTGTPPGVPTQVAGAPNTTRDGRVCDPGVRQIPVSTYATQCLARFSGNNGGATWKGVSGEEIIIVERRFPETTNSRAVDSVNESAGAASNAENDRVNETFRNYMNEAFELYGRTVKWVPYESQFGNGTTEAQSKGREEACLDADVVANELGAFAVVGTRTGAVSGPFTECAAERGVVVLNGAAYFPEKFYADRHPYAWAYTMECERISYQVAEYIGKRLGKKPAQWAGDPILQATPREYATYVPNNDEYQYCVDINARVMKDEYGIEGRSRYNYTLDVSRFPDEAARGAVQFKADGATTVVLACDPISVIFLTQAAVKQAYFPEWLLIGVAAQDTDLYGQLYDQQATDGHMFGLSQLGETSEIVGPDSEPGHLYTHITGEPMADGATGGYIQLNMVYSMLQNAGPGLTPNALAAGVASIPVGGAPNFPYGRTSFAEGVRGDPTGGDHTWIDDSREIYWSSDQVSETNGTPGTFIATYDGRRFGNGEWPSENPPIYPGS